MRRPKTFILNEQEHLENLRKIIKRDFFRNTGENEEDGIKMGLNDYIANFKSDQNQVFTELAKQHDEDWKKQHQWMQKCSKFMLQSGRAQYKPYSNMISKDPALKAIDFTHVQQDPQNAVFFSPTRETKSYRNSDHYQAKKVLYQNCRLDEKEFQKTLQTYKKLIRDPNLQEVPDTPLLQGKQTPLQRGGEDEYSIKRAPSPEPEQLPIMTWGQVESTPLRLSKQQYRMAQTPRRDILLQQMNSKITKQKMIKKNKKQELKNKILSSVRLGGSSYRKVSMPRMDSTKRPAKNIELDGLLKRRKQ